ncbi:MAG: DUF433 domain-containing protein [Tepidiformaceae bacterium]
MGEIVELSRGIYPAPRASALSGVPVSTLHYWARKDVLLPSASQEPRTRLWTWGDLLVLRVVHWLRSTKPDAKATTMAEVRQTLDAVAFHGVNADELADLIVVTAAGRVVFEFKDGPHIRPSGQAALRDVLAVVGPFGDAGPDLLRPGDGLRIVPGKLSGEPHIEGSRISTAAVFALKQRGYSPMQMAEMYPELDERGFIEAIRLEQRLRHAS